MLDNLIQIFILSKRIKSILLAILFASIGNNILVVILPINLEDGGISTAIIGWVMAGYSLGVFLGSQYGHIIISQVGHIRSYAAVGAVMSTVAGLHIFIDHEWMVLVMRVLVGVSMAIIYLTLESWLNATSESQSRGTIYSLYQFSYGLGLLVAPFIATIFTPGDLRSFNLVALFVSLSLIPLVMTHFKTPQLSGNQRKLPIIEMLRDTPSASIMSIISGICLSSLISLSTLFGVWLELEKSQLAIFISMTIGSSVLFQVPIGKLSDKFDERVLILILVIISLVSSILILLSVYWQLSWEFITLIMFILGGCFFCFYPLCVKFVFNQMDSDKAIPALSTLLIMFSIGSVIGPILASLFMEFIAPWGLFLFFCILLVISTIFMTFRVMQSSSPERDAESVPYVITIKMLRPMSVNLDPRTDYLMSKVNNSTVQSLVESIAVSPAKAHKLIENNLQYLEMFKPEELLESLVLIKPRLSKPIIRAMILLYPDKTLDFTHILRDLIALGYSNINRLLFIGLTHKAAPELQQEVKDLFDQFILENQKNDAIKNS